ncbi:hypothetical protein SKAU_G00065200 [Synaphobranchus kaupii]|uniref:Uncharacterized protein n=1 Tax=Synaphobranchus kaupii TaxID=118154 RepID=A0A9Q1G5U1_SYNKA|nr:hypothetical protein SKAU_G00065200 [Synaphobranchus kaupii]
MEKTTSPCHNSSTQLSKISCGAALLFMFCQFVLEAQPDKNRAEGRAFGTAGPSCLVLSTAPASDRRQQFGKRLMRRRRGGGSASDLEQPCEVPGQAGGCPCKEPGLALPSPY